MRALILRALAGWHSRMLSGCVDWVYWSLIGVSIASLGWFGAARLRLSHTVQRAHGCLAQQDVACATDAVSSLVAHDPDPDRPAIAQANLYVLLGELDRATTALGRLRPETHTRGDYLLAQGDLLLARHQWQQARERFQAAQGVVSNEALLTARLARLDQAEAALQQHQTSLLSALRTRFDQLCQASSKGDADGVVIARQAILDLEGSVPHGPQRKLREARGWAAQAQRKAMRRKILLSRIQPASEPPRFGLPSPPSPSALRAGPAARQRYLKRRARASQTAQRYQEARAQRERELSLQATQLAVEVQTALAKARAALEQALDELAALPPTALPEPGEP